MLLEEFDENRNDKIHPDLLISPIPDFPKITISCFSTKLFEALLQQFDYHKISELSSAVGLNPVYEVKYRNHRFALFQSLAGESFCVAQYEDLIARGSQCLILTGNCGVLDSSIEDCGIIIPIQAIRDERTSYDYAKTTDYIEVNRKYRKEFKKILENKGYSYVEGITWTTDAPYRETDGKIQKRKQQGAICVEMECAGMQALCNFRHTDFFQFFYAGDNLDHSSFEPESISGSSKLDEQTKIMFLAFELGAKIIENREKIKKKYYNGYNRNMPQADIDMLTLDQYERKMNNEGGE